MIVKATAHGWEIVYHHAHALLAAQLAAALHPRFRPERWVEVLEAIAFHDDEQQDFSGRNFLNKAGAPLDFTQRPYTIEQARQVTLSSRFKSRRVNLIISQHMSYLYEGLAQDAGNKDLKEFCREQRQLQKRLIKELNYTPEQAQAEYGLLRWCDQVSLFLCQEGLPEGSLRVETGPGPGQTNYLLRRDEGRIKLAPWPFEGKALDVFCEVRTLPQLSYRDDAELMAALEAAPVGELAWRFQPDA